MMEQEKTKLKKVGNEHQHFITWGVFFPKNKHWGSLKCVF